MKTAKSPWRMWLVWWLALAAALSGGAGQAEATLTGADAAIYTDAIAPAGQQDVVMAADVSIGSGSYSRYDFTYYYADGSGDYYQGYVYAPTAFQSSGPGLNVGTKLYEQPMEFWASGYRSLNGGYYQITGMADGYDASYDKQSYITGYYDTNGANTSFEVNADGSQLSSYVDGHLHVLNRTAAQELGYAVRETPYGASYFTPYTSATLAGYSLSLGGRLPGSDRYDFTYYYTDGSRDTLSGYLYAPGGTFTPGATYSSLANPLAVNSNGYFLIDRETPDARSADLYQEYITSYYDGDTNRTSSTFSTSPADKTAASYYYVSDYRQGDPSFYVFDPLVPQTDRLFGNSLTIYPVSPASSGNAVNFLVTYYQEPYWDQPDAYLGSCAQVASAELLAWYDAHGYPNLIAGDWAMWTDNNTREYVRLIGTLAKYEGWQYGWGTTLSGWAIGLNRYIQAHGYTFNVEVLAVNADRNSAWHYFTGNMEDHPVMMAGYCDQGGHATVAMGYWNNHQILTNMGWGGYVEAWDYQNTNPSAWNISYFVDVSVPQ